MEMQAKIDNKNSVKVFNEKILLKNEQNILRMLHSPRRFRDAIEFDF